MPILLTLIYFTLTLVALGFAAELLARGTEELEKRVGEGLAGGIVLGLLTALPETIITLAALIEGEYEVAFGSAIGGNVILFTLGIGLVGALYFLAWRTTATLSVEYAVENRFMIVATLIMLAILAYGKIDFISGTILLSMYFYYVYYRVRKASKENSAKIVKIDYKKSVLELVVGTAILLALSGYFVNYVAEIASYLGVPAVWLSLIVVPIAGELEEKISGIRLAMRNREGASLALISFVGSKIQNATFLLGIIGFFTSYSIYSSLAEYIAVIVSNLLGIITLYNRKLSLTESIFLIFLYFVIVYITYIFR